MNYSSSKKTGVIIQTLGLDLNGNRRTRLKFYHVSKKDKPAVHYKTAVTNEALDPLTIDEIVKVWG